MVRFAAVLARFALVVTAFFTAVLRLARTLFFGADAGTPATGATGATGAVTGDVIGVVIGAVTGAGATGTVPDACAETPVTVSAAQVPTASTAIVNFFIRSFFYLSDWVSQLPMQSAVALWERSLIKT